MEAPRRRAKRPNLGTVWAAIQELNVQMEKGSREFREEMAERAAERDRENAERKVVKYRELQGGRTRANEMKTIDEYIETFEPEIQKTLIEIRNFIKNQVPDAVEKISYGMPTFHLQAPEVCRRSALPTPARHPK